MLVDEVLFDPDVPSKQATDEMVRELMAIVERACHLLLLDHQDPASCKSGSGLRAERLTCHASRTQVVSRMQNREDRLLTPLRPNCDLHVPFLDIEHFLAGIAL